jgi:hypothetical protein
MGAISDAALEEVRTRGFVVVEGLLRGDELRATEAAAWEEFPSPDDYFAEPERHRWVNEHQFSGLPRGPAGSVLIYSTGAGLRERQAPVAIGASPGAGRVDSIAEATSSRRRSAPGGATSWRPMGRPSSVNPAGIEIAGQPVTVMMRQVVIHSR